MGIKEKLEILILGNAKDAVGAFSSLETAGKKLNSFLTGALAAGIAGIAAASGVAIVGLKNAIKAAAENELIQNRLANTIRNTGNVTGVTVNMVNDLAGSISRLTRFEDDSISAAGEIISRYTTISKETFPEVLKLSADLAEVMGVDITQAAQVMGKVLAEPGEGLRVLKEAGVSLSKQQERMLDRFIAVNDVAGAQALIMDALTSSIGGASQAAADTASGKWDQIKNQFGNISDTLGESLTPALNDFLAFLLTYMQGYEFTNFVRELATSIGELATAMVEKLPTAIGDFRRFLEFIILNKETILNWVYGLGAAFGILFLAMNPMALVFATLGLAVWVFMDHWKTAGETLKNIGGIFTGLWTLLKIKVSEALMGVYNIIAKYVKPIWEGFRQGLERIVQVFADIVKWVKDVIAWFKRLGDSIPKALIPGSPTPFEMGLRGINSELDAMSKKTLPNLTGGVSFSTTSQGGAATNAGVTAELYGIRDEIRFLVRTLPKAIRDATA